MKLGELRKFDKPVLIDIPYDAKNLGDRKPEDGFIAVSYDETLKAWVDVTFEVMPDKSVVRLKMSHLTTVQACYTWMTFGAVYKTGCVSITYYKGSAAQKKSFADYEKTTGKTPTGGIPCFVEDLADMANAAVPALVGEKLHMPAAVTIYVTDGGGTAYKGMTGNILVAADIGSQMSPTSLLQRDIGRELFRMAQAYTLGPFDYLSALKGDGAFWMDATAEYMGNTGVWTLVQQAGKSPYGPVSQYRKYGLDFFEKSLFTVDGVHEFQAASFVQYLQATKSAVSSKKLVEIAATNQPFPDAFSGCYGLDSG